MNRGYTFVILDTGALRGRIYEPEQSFMMRDKECEPKQGPSELLADVFVGE